MLGAHDFRRRRCCVHDPATHGPQIGQAVRRIDTTDVGMVIGVLLGEVDRAIVRWPGDVGFEVMDDLVVVRQPA